MGGNMNYNDIYDSKFLDKFGEYKSKVSSIVLKDKYEIDVLAIAKTCDILVEYIFSEHSGWSINDDSSGRSFQSLQHASSPNKVVLLEVFVTKHLPQWFEGRAEHY